ncbi:MAG: hypothetical protein MMC33_005088 [Icmadophila ericetorum]|nr:hypothetical protein [Icmadophila ericetorum]
MASRSPTSGALSPVSAESGGRQRPPPPTLFQAPSQNASSTSLSLRSPQTLNSPLSTLSPTGQPRVPLQRNRSNRESRDLNVSSPLGRPSQQQRQQQQQQNERDQTDKLWAEMQATLGDVELSAARGNHFFDAQHAAALEELRVAQISLAQAWARNETEEVIDHPDENEEKIGEGKGIPGESNAGSNRAEFDEETERDILIARKRRAANDKYFTRVSAGVLDVVGKLDEVAVAMEKVEKKSREIWGESESLEAGSSNS